MFSFSAIGLFEEIKRISILGWHTSLPHCSRRMEQRDTTKLWDLLSGIEQVAWSSFFELRQKEPTKYFPYSKWADCFCGEYKFYTIETIQTESEANWKTVAFGKAKVLWCVPTESCLFSQHNLTFRGEWSEHLSTFILSEQGELERDFWADSLIPGAPSASAVVNGISTQLGSTRLNRNQSVLILLLWEVTAKLLVLKPEIALAWKSTL